MSSLRLLLVEDSPDDAALLMRQLSQGGYRLEAERVETAEGMRRRLDEGEWDLVIADYSLPAFSAFDALTIVKEKNLDVPFIIVSGNIGEEMAVSAMKAGAHDYVMKGNAARLLPAIARELREAVERANRRKAEQALRESEKRFRSLIENASDITTVLSADGEILYESPSVERVLGHSPGQLIGQPLLEFVHPDDAPAIRRLLEEIRGAPPTPVEFRGRHRDGNWCYLEATSNNLLDDPNVRGIVVNCRDITDRKRDEEMILHLAYYDALTELPNRTLFYDRLTQAMAHARRLRQSLVVMFLDLDRFKMINDTLGHAVGDELLRAVAQRLSGLLREEDTVARFGGDEFSILLPTSPEIEGVVKIAQKTLDAFVRPFLLSGREFHITASIGICMFPNDGQDPDTLLRNADTALYRAKEQGRDNYQLYTPAMNAIAFERLVLENSLRQALDKNEFLLFYQPVVDLENGRTTGVEALIRWRHPDLGLIPPIKFIPLAEDTGIIVSLGQWVLRTACAQAKAWHDQGLKIEMAVNLSARQLNDRSLVQSITAILKETSFDPQYLTLELTESVVMQNVESNIKTLQDLKAMGIKLSIDDFGTGYSSLSYLKRLPIDTLKIDQSFVRDISTDPDDAAIATLIITMAHALKLSVVAEGVENSAQVAFLRPQGCDRMQGFLVSRPLPADEILTHLEGERE